jgi:C-terminal processing protease CtpA/Prc
MINGQIVIGDVAKDSPAEKAGVNEGDEVIAVNKNFTQNLNTYKVILQAPNEKIKLILRRNGELKEIEFRVRSIR